MKPMQILFAALLGAAVTTHGALYPSDFRGSGLQDRNLREVSATRATGWMGFSVDAANVSYQLSGGANGTVLAPLSGDGVLAQIDPQTRHRNWTAVYADMSSGSPSNAAALVNWSLEIAAVPEPVNLALGALGAVIALGIVARTRPVRSRVRRWRNAFEQWVDAV
jgi:hypothetical protein